MRQSLRLRLCLRRRTGQLREAWLCAIAGFGPGTPAKEADGQQEKERGFHGQVVLIAAEDRREYKVQSTLIVERANGFINALKVVNLTEHAIADGSPLAAGSATRLAHTIFIWLVLGVAPACCYGV